MHPRNQKKSSRFGKSQTDGCIPQGSGDGQELPVVCGRLGKPSFADRATDRPAS